MKRTVVVTLLLAAALAAGCGRKDNMVEIPAGSSFVVALSAPISTSASKAGDSFEARVDQPLALADEPVIDVGSVVRGELTSVVSGADGHSTPSLTLVFREFVDDSGEAHPIQARALVVAGMAPDATAPSETDTPSGIPDAAMDDVAPSTDTHAGTQSDSQSDTPVDESAAAPTPSASDDTPGPILAAGPGPVMLPGTDGEVMLPSGQELRVELAASARLPL